MNRLFTFSASLLLAASTASASCPREDLHTYWSLLLPSGAFNEEDFANLDAQAMAEKLEEELAPIGVLEIDPEGYVELLLFKPLRDATPAVLDVYVDQTCEVYRDQPIAELVRFLQTPDGQALLDAAHDPERATALFGDLYLRPSPYEASWDELLGFFDDSVEIEDALSARIDAIIAQITDQILWEDAFADMFERRDIVSFKSEQHRELAIKAYRATADVKQLNGSQ